MAMPPALRRSTSSFTSHVYTRWHGSGLPRVRGRVRGRGRGRGRVRVRGRGRVTVRIRVRGRVRVGAWLGAAAQAAHLCLAQPAEHL